MKSTAIEKSFTFSVAIHYEDSFLINSYTVKLSMSILTDDHREQQVSVDRIGYWLNYMLQNSVIIQDTNEDQIIKYAYAGIGVCTLPDEPFDQLLSMILLLKLNAITENKIVITSLKLESMLSDGVGYTMNLEDAEDLYGYNRTSGWWNLKDVSMSDFVHAKEHDEKVINLFDSDDWTAAGLNWKEKTKTL